MSEAATQTKAYLDRDRAGTSSAWGHCNLCPRADDAPCTLPCLKVREETESRDGIKVVYP